MPPVTPSEVIESQRQDWNRVASGWDKWDDYFSRSMTFINHRLVADARLRPGMRVLDIGSGTGYPALLAGEVVGATGQVAGIDLAESMLAVASRKAKAREMSHVTFRTGDATALPFDASSFDAVISRFCLMFLPEITKALKDMVRVLKPGGYVAAAVWSAPEKNPFIRIPMDVIKSIVTLPPPEPDAPGVFRLAKPGELKGLMEGAGLTPLSEEEFLANVTYATAEEFFNSVLDLAGPLQNIFAKLTAEQKAQAQRDIIDVVNTYQRQGQIVFPIAVRFVAAYKAE